MEARVLIIDDNADLSSIIMMILEAEGFEVRMAYQLNEGLTEARSWKPDVLLLDVNVDGEDSRAFCNELKSDNSSLKIILMSGDETTLDHTELFGADEQIAKPFDSVDLIHKIQLCLESLQKIPNSL